MCWLVIAGFSFILFEFKKNMAMEYPMLYRQREPMGRSHTKAAVEEFMWIGWCRGNSQIGHGPSEQSVGQRLQRCAKCNKFMCIKSTHPTVQEGTLPPTETEDNASTPAPAPSTEEKLQSQTPHDKFKVIIHVCIVQAAGHPLNTGK